ncbi:hypothetical protein [Nocardia cyriacigeorgica]|uniref:hypothetical protein n=1 Tax=Nocardia cyriacigeorgica TaxID=135487 RepID=UPI001893AB65|nr:hypothetical protein [Nocardia cyriacigeorgica]MBF6162987.1 hypothetical protein [Nocardia cyriacigeorgica]MBF6201966.1 hypothetical protein [Nocardia cyriacigeorgica]
MNTKTNIDAAREYYDTHSAVEEIENAVPGEPADTSPMSGYSVRLPTDVLNQARKFAAERGMTTGAWLREAIENAVTSHGDPGDTVPVADLLALVARHQPAAKTADLSRLVPADFFERLAAASKLLPRPDIATLHWGPASLLANTNENSLVAEVLLDHATSPRYVAPTDSDPKLLKGGKTVSVRQGNKRIIVTTLPSRSAAHRRHSTGRSRRSKI